MSQDRPAQGPRGAVLTAARPSGGGKPRPSLRQFARLAGVSPATVSRVFSDKGDMVASETREHVLTLADSCGFRPAAINRVSFGGRTNSVGVLVPMLGVSYFADFTLGLQQELLPSGILPMILQSQGDSERLAVRRLLDHRVDALVLLLVDETLHQDDFLEVLPAQVPLLLIGPTRSGLQGDTVDTDDVEGGRLAGEHLLALGHRRLGFCYFGEGHSSCDNRLKGFRSALGAHGVVLRDEDIAYLRPHMPQDEMYDRLREDLKRILTGPERATAIFASTDLLALEVYRVAAEMGLRIPEDLSVVGYADLDFAAFVQPPLTTIRQDGVAVGRRAGELLLRRFEAPEAAMERAVIGVGLVKRGSTR
jgi:LacI family transcriptional regulator